MAVHGHGTHHTRHASHGTRNLHGDPRLAAASYLLGPFSGALVYKLASPRDHYARWHAVQSIGVGLGLALLGFVASMLAMNGVGTANGLFGMTAIMTVFWVGAVAVVCMLAIAAYRGDPVRVPYVADFADRYK